eukprot:jgi/Chlat1/3809/Chrsp259S03948
MATFSLKLDFNGDVRKRTVPLDLQFDALQATVRDMYGFSAGDVFQFKYTDDDNDIVTLANHDDLCEALANLKRDGNSVRSLRLSVVKVGGAPATAAPPPFAGKPAAAAAQPAKAPGASSSAPKGLAKVIELIKQVAKEVNVDVDDVLQVYQEQGAYAAAQKLQATVLRAQLTPLQLAGMYYKIISNIRPDEMRNIMADFEGGLPNMFETFGIPKPSAFAAGSSKQAEEAFVPPTAPAAPDDSSKPEDGAPVYHHNVVCDGCNQSPLEGSRYKSLEKEDYDLCQLCYDKEDRKEEYVCIVRPGDRAWLNAMRNRHGRCGGWGRGGRHPFMPYPAPNANGVFQHPWGRVPHHAGPWGPHHGGRWGGRHGPCGFGAGKPDARFVSDITIFDGTEVLPGQKFTKIWKIKNSGNCPWPPSTHLVHVGGDIMSVESVPVPVPEGGLLPDQDLDVSVDMVAPSEPGRYVSHWRLAWTNNGPKFGHRLWALIQVVPSEEAVKTADASPATVVGECAVGMDIAADVVMQDASAVQMTVAMTALEPSTVVEELVQVPVELVATGPSAVVVEGVSSKDAVADQSSPQPAVVNSQPVVQQFVQEDMLENVDQLQQRVAVIDIASVPALPSAQALAESGVVVPDVKEEDKWVKITPNTQQDEMPAQEDNVADYSYTKQLQQLADMGFTDMNLIREVLNATEGDLDTSVARLVAATGWDAQLRELNDMGFFDKELNMRLMVKNNGSIARTVKELVELSMFNAGSVMVLD